jgi:hypothetical protein
MRVKAFAGRYKTLAKHKLEIQSQMEEILYEEFGTDAKCGDSGATATVIHLLRDGP